MSVIDDFIGRYEGTQKAMMEHVRAVISSAAPDAEERISYGMPAFYYKGKYLVGFSVFTAHYGIYPGAEAVATFEHQLTGYQLAKGTIQFTDEHPLDDSLLADIISHGLMRINRDNP